MRNLRLPLSAEKKAQRCRLEGLGFGVLGLEFGDWGLGFRDLGVGVQGSRIWGLGFRVWGLGFGLRTWGFAGMLVAYCKRGLYRLCSVLGLYSSVSASNMVAYLSHPGKGLEGPLMIQN